MAEGVNERDNQHGGIWTPGPLSRRVFLAGGAAIGASALFGGRAMAHTAGTTAATTAAGATPKTGGSLRVGVIGGTNDIVDGQYIVAKPDQARLVAGWETLVTYDDKFNVVFTEGLAESVEAKAADQYVIRLREGVEFHNGKTLGAADLIYSFQRLVDKDLGLAPPVQALLDASGVTKVDDRTVQVQLKQ